MRPQTLIPLLLALVASKLALAKIGDVDLPWHIRLGLDALERGHLPRTVEYSWTATSIDYLPNDWLAELLLAAAYHVAGWPAVAVLKVGVIVGLVLAVYFGSWLRAGCNYQAAGVATTLAMLVASADFITRPVLFGHACLAAELVVLELAKRGRPRVLWALPVIFGLWVNLHGSWPIGFGPLGVALASALVPISWRRFGTEPHMLSLRRPLVLTSMLSIAALFLNPGGTRMVFRPIWLFFQHRNLGPISEWSPVPLTEPAAWIFLALGALILYGWVLPRLPVSPYDVGLIACVFTMATSAALYYFAFALIAAPVAAQQLDPVMRGLRFQRLALNTTIAMVTLLLLGAIGVKGVREAGTEVFSSTPVRAVSALERLGLSQSPGFNYFDWGGYLVLRKIPTFIDGRLEPFLQNGVFDEYIAIEQRGDAKALEARGVRWALTPRQTHLAKALTRRDGWRLEYSDELANVFTHAAY